MVTKIRRALLLAVVTVASLGADCCDNQHGILVQGQPERDRIATLCETRGGIPIMKSWQDGGQHWFRGLERCDFPPGPVKLQGEKGG